MTYSYNSEDAGDGAYGLSSLSKKTRTSNHLQMSLRRQFIVLSYFKTLSVGPVWGSNPIETSRTVVRRSTNYHFSPLVAEERACVVGFYTCHRTRPVLLVCDPRQLLQLKHHLVSISVTTVTLEAQYNLDSNRLVV